MKNELTKKKKPKVNFFKVYEGIWDCWFLMFYKD